VKSVVEEDDQDNGDHDDTSNDDKGVDDSLLDLRTGAISLDGHV